MERIKRIGMKNFIAAVIFMGLPFVSQAQTYTLAFDSLAYQELENDTIISDSNWVGQHYLRPIPFPVRVSNVAVSQIYVNTDGRIRRLTGSGTSASYRTMIWGFGNCGLRRKNNEASHISYKVDGVSPERIAKIQFKNAGFVGDEAQTEKVNFQIWLFEDGKRIEIRFGETSPGTLTALNGAYGPFLGLGAQYVRGLPDAPLLGTLDYGLNGMPRSGYRYAFSRP
jgi:hypothetical protein